MIRVITYLRAQLRRPYLTPPPRHWRWFASTTTLLVVVSLALVTALAVGTRTWLATAKAGRQGQAQAKPSTVPVDVVKITLRSFGFESQQITRKGGRVYFFVENASGFRKVNFRLDREAGARLKDVSLPLGKFRWQEVLELTPGTYLLTVAEKPNWICRITIIPR